MDDHNNDRDDLNNADNACPPFLAALLARRTLHDARPNVTLTFAQSLDAKIAGHNGSQLILSGPQSMLMTHWMRSMHDAILVGVATALNDNPQLNTRLLPPPLPGNPPHPLPRPVILDSALRLPPTCKLLTNYNARSGRRPWLIAATPQHDDPAWTARRDSLANAGAEIIHIDAPGPILPLHSVLAVLRARGIRTLMVEGGASVIASFLAHTIDTLIVTVAPTLVGSDAVAYSLQNIPNLVHVHTEVLGKDTVFAMSIQ